MTLRTNRRQFLAGSTAAAGVAAFPIPAIAQNAPMKVGLLTVKTGPLAAGGHSAPKILRDRCEVAEHRLALAGLLDPLRGEGVLEDMNELLDGAHDSIIRRQGSRCEARRRRVRR